jgi:hypothetical protein
MQVFIIFVNVNRVGVSCMILRYFVRWDFVIYIIYLSLKNEDGYIKVGM